MCKLSGLSVAVDVVEKGNKSVFCVGRRSRLSGGKSGDGFRSLLQFMILDQRVLCSGL